MRQVMKYVTDPTWLSYPEKTGGLHLSAKNMTNDTLEEEEHKYTPALAQPDRLHLAFQDRGAKFLENDLI
ncbi:hypothetical protein NQZ68_016202, partial [Dissostichus eleginoides]